MSAAEYMFVVLLIVLGVVTRKARDRYFLSQRTSYTKIMIGCGLLLAMMLVRAIADEGLIPYFASQTGSVYRSFAEALLLVSACIFLSVGLTEWLPRLAAADLKAVAVRNDLKLLSSIASAKEALTDRMQFATEVVRLVKFSLRAAEVTLCRVDRESEKLHQVGRSRVASENTEFYRAAQSASSSAKAITLKEGDPEDPRPVALVPIDIDGISPSILLIRWPMGAIITDSVEQMMVVLASQLCSRQEEQNKNARMLLSDLLPGLAVKLLTTERLSDQIYMIDDALRTPIGYEILRIAIYDPRGLNVTQYCVGKGKNLLAERDKAISTSQTLLERLFNNPDITHVRELQSSQYEDDLWLSGCGVDCAVTIPLMVGQRVVAAVTFASADNELGWLCDDRLVAALRGTLAPMVQCETLQAELVSFNRRILDMTGALKQLVSSDDHQSALQGIIDTVVRKLPTTCGRIWRYDSGSETLELVSEARIRDLGKEAGTIAKLRISDARRHKQALLGGRLLVSNQADENSCMDEHELSTAQLTGMQSALLIPLLVGSEPIGLLAIAEMRSWKRRSYSLPETMFVRGMANLAALTLVSSEHKSSLRELNGRVRRLRETQTVNRIFAGLPQKLATPLTSIMARSERLLATPVADDPEALRNLEIIRRQTEVMLDEIRTLQETRQNTLAQMT